YVISGGAGAPLYKKEHDAPETQRFESVHHFVEVSVSGEQVQIVARRASGSVIEACGFHADGPWICDHGADPASVTPASGGPAPVAPRKPAAPPEKRSRACRCGLPGQGPRGEGWIVTLAAAAASSIKRRRDRCA